MLWLISLDLQPMEKCKACKQVHYGFCEEKSIPLSTRIKAGKWVDGDRVSDYLDNVLDGSSKKILGEVVALERQLKRLSTRSRRLGVRQCK